MKNKFALVLVIFVFLHTLRYFDYIEFNPTIGGWISKICSLFFIFFSIKNRFIVEDMPMKNVFLGLLLIPISSFLSCWIENGQSFFESARVYLPYFLVLVYFYCHKKRIDENSLIKWITILAIIRTSLLIIQQFTYPDYWFAFRTEGYDEDLGIVKEIEVRSGILRFYIEDTYLSMFIVFFYLQKMLERFNWRIFVIFLYGLVGIYMDQSRQFMVTTFASIFIVLLFGSSIKQKLKYLGWLSIFVVILFVFADRLFEELMEKTVDESSEDNIRIMAYYFFSVDFWGGPLSIVFGNGLPGRSSYGDLCKYYSTDYGLYRADVGIVGAMSLFGIVSVIYLLYAFGVILIKKWNCIDAYLRMFFLSSFLSIPLITIYTQNLNYFVFWSLMFYLMDLSIKKNTKDYSDQICHF